MPTYGSLLPRCAALVGALFFGAAAGCGAGDESPRLDAAAASDGGDGAGGLPVDCGDACRQTALSAAFGGSERTLTRAHFGTGDSAPPTLYVEAYAGGAAGCPEEDSPAAAVIFVLGELAVPETTSAYSSTAGLIDLEGALLPGQPTASASEVSVEALAFQPDAFLALRVTAEFAEGRVVGSIGATHCRSLDASRRSRGRALPRP